MTPKTVGQHGRGDLSTIPVNYKCVVVLVRNSDTQGSEERCVGGEMKKPGLQVERFRLYTGRRQYGNRPPITFTPFIFLQTLNSPKNEKTTNGNRVLDETNLKDLLGLSRKVALIKERKW